MIIPQLFKVCNHDQNDISRTLTIAKQSEVLMKKYVLVICFNLIETKSKKLMNPFAVVDINYAILGVLFFDKYKQFIKILNFTMNFKHSFKDQPTTASFTTPIETFPFLFCY